MHRLMINCISFFLLCLSMTVHALPTDRQQTIHVAADTATLSQQEHKGIYSGHVEFVQGTTNLQAMQAETKGNAKNQLILAIAKGDGKHQAHYWTKTHTDKPLMHAYADIIYYHPLKHLIILTGHARVIQGKNSFSGAKITYDTVKQHVVSESNHTLRTTIVIYPEKKSS